MNRRNFLGIMLAACAAPTYVRAGSLMRVNPVIAVPDITVIIQQYSQLYAYTDKSDELTHPDTVRADPFGERKIIVADWRNGPITYNAHWMKRK